MTWHFRKGHCVWQRRSLLRSTTMASAWSIGALSVCFYGSNRFGQVFRFISGLGGAVGRWEGKSGGAPAPIGNRTGPATTSLTGVSRAIAAQYTRVDALRQTVGGSLCPSGRTAAVAAGARPLHPSRALRRLVGVHPCALVCAVLPLRNLAVAALGAAQAQPVGELLVFNLLVTVDVEEGGAYPLCVRPSSGATRSGRTASGSSTAASTAAT